MSLVHASIDQFADFLPPSNKRKLDDYSPVDESDDLSDFVVSTIRMRKFDSLYSAPSDFHYCKGNNFVNSAQSLHDSKTLICGESSRSHSLLQLQFFVRMISGGSTLVLRGNLNDTVEMVHEKIQSITGIPMVEQRLIYRGKQLQWEQTLADCSIQNDAGLQLVGRMRSTEHPRAWWVINDLVSIICRICKKDSSVSNVRVRALRGKLDDYINRIPNRDNEASDSYSIRVVEYFKVFVDSGAPKALVMLYMSPEKSNKDCADDCIRRFINSVHHLEIPEKEYVATIVLELSKLLRQVGDDDLLYLFCRNALGSMVATVGDECMRKKIANYYVRCIKMEDILPFFRELADRLSKDLVLSVESNGNVGPSFSDVTDFSAFLHPVVCLVTRFGGLGKVRVEEALTDDVISDGEEAKLLLLVYTNLFGQIDQCLQKMEQLLDVKSEGDMETFRSGWSQYLDILKELHSISELYRGTEVKFWDMMRCRKTVVRALIVGYAKHSDDHKWLFDYKDVMNFKSRRHLAMLMFPEVKEDFEELHEMLIDRSHLLAESFEYILRAEPSSLHAGLFMEFKNEEATGPGVLREWFFLVCQAIFNPQNALFAACPHDRRRFFPNPASKVDPMHLKYFRFSGRVVALALMHKLQVGIVLDRVFFLQLAGRDISLEDIKDADPDMYNSCKQILEMDAEFIDSDALGLTFVREVVELGSRKVVDLCPGGKSIIVNSSNRGQYISLCIQHCFVKSIREQVNEFAQGFADILCKTALRTSFFQSLELQDLDWMLHGNGSAISVEDWKEHTEYHGYKKSDRQILWFWEVVGQMLDEQKKILLFFWTSLKYLPVEGFHGLASQLFIYKAYEPPDHLPSSHTCFYRLCIPTYPSKTVMEERLCTITREHIGCSFGNW